MFHVINNYNNSSTFYMQMFIFKKYWERKMQHNTTL
jgi:hypothetical protein